MRWRAARCGAPIDIGAQPEELHYKLIERFAPPSILVNGQYDIVHMSDEAGKFLQFSGGEPTRNLLQLVHPMLRLDLRAALFSAAQSQRQVDALKRRRRPERQSQSGRHPRFPCRRPGSGALAGQVRFASA